MKIVSIKKRTFLVLISLLCFNSAFALDTDRPGVLKGVKVLEDSVIVVFSPSTGIDNEICNLVEGGYQLLTSHVLFDELYSMLLSAALTDTSITVTFQNDQKSPCLVKAATL